MIFIILFSTNINFAFENSGPSNSSSPRSPSSPRELQIAGNVKRSHKYSKDKTRLKRETYSVTFNSGNSLEISCTYNTKRAAIYEGETIKNQEKTKINTKSAEQDFNKLKVLYMQQNPGRL